MGLTILLGAQWGDEGKGRVTDLLAEDADVTARFSGGDNAGHTVTVGTGAAARTFKLHLLPSGVIQSRTVNVLGNGMVINPARLRGELAALAQGGITLSPERLKISHAAHLITPAHVALDKAEEDARGADKLGTTGRGIGPAYTAKISRGGLRAELFKDPETLADKIEAHVARVNRTLTGLYGAAPLDPAAIASEYAEHAQALAPYITETSLYLDGRLKAGAHVIAEGAQGSLLDIDHGTYPYVTSSSPTTGGVLTGLGVGARYIDRVIGVTKVFQTRVGEGPFPTEAFGAEGDRLRGTGANPWDEFGTTTGRPRRCGWLDLVLLRYTIRINGLTELVLTKLDVLSGLDRVRLCTGYRDPAGRLHAELPYGPSDLAPFTADYEDLPGWSEDVGGARQSSDLPAAARAYIERISALTGVPVSLVSVGPERSQIIRL
ncbi:MAG: adenylosuccinate synthase [Anaerolineales bacterium]|nr:adenylosuccinate synthase [Anaerolineales bacterium]